MSIVSTEYEYKKFLTAYLKSSPVDIGPDEDFNKLKEDEFKEINTYFTDDFVKELIDWVKIDYPTVETDDLKPICFEIEGIGPFLIGQRFKNGDRKMPFVILVLGFEEEKLSSVIEDIKKIAQQSYPKTKPLGLTVSLRFTDKVPDGAKVWNQVVYGKYNEQVNSSNVRLEVADTPIPYPEYCRIYEDWSAHNSELSRFVSKESEEDLEESAKAGLYFKFFVDNELAGIICGERESLYGHDAIYIFEELLFQKFRGQGLAKTMQRIFHNQFPEVKYIWGHILNENKPSLKTALSCKRKILEKEVFFPFS